MSKTKYSNKQINEIKRNKNVSNCTNNSILFEREFKDNALCLDKQWISPKEIFKTNWFPKYILDSDIPTCSLKNWKKLVKRWWAPYIINPKRWRKKKGEVNKGNLTLEQENEYLKAEVSYRKKLHKIKWSHYP